MFKIFFTNFGYYSQETFDNLDAAIAYGKDKFFEFQVVVNDAPVYVWSVFGGGRKI